MTTGGTKTMKTGGGWRRGLWLAPLSLAVLAFLAYVLPPYLTLDPSRSRIPPPPAHPVYYPILVLHVGCAAIAMASGLAQIWTGVKGAPPGFHRLLGRVYVFCGVLPAGVMALALSTMGQFGPVLIASDVTLATLWLTATITGYRMMRRGQVAAHRRWMTRSYALTLSIISNRLWLPVVAAILAPHLATTFQGNETLMYYAIAGLAGWIGWVLPLILTEWVIVGRVGAERGAAKRPERAPSPVLTGGPAN